MLSIFNVFAVAPNRPFIFSASPGDGADRRDPIPFKGHIADERRSARTVNDGAAADHEVGAGYRAVGSFSLSAKQLYCRASVAVVDFSWHLPD